MCRDEVLRVPRWNEWNVQIPSGPVAARPPLAALSALLLTDTCSMGVAHCKRYGEHSCFLACFASLLAQCSGLGDSRLVDTLLSAEDSFPVPGWCCSAELGRIEAFEMDTCSFASVVGLPSIL